MTTYRLMDGASGRPGVGSSGTTPPALTPYTSTPFQAGTLFSVLAGGMWLQGYWWWVPVSGDTAPQKFCLWQQYGTGSGNRAVIPGATVTSGTLTAGAMNFIPLATPIQLAIGTLYIAATGWQPSHGFPDSNNQFASGQPYSGGITSGPLTAWGDTPNGSSYGFSASSLNWGLNQGLFGTGSAGTAGDPALNFPGGGSNSSNFWMDAQVSDTAPGGYSGSYRIWPSRFGAEGTGIDTAANYILATELLLSQACELDSIWFYSPPGATQLPTQCAIWDVPSQAMVSGTLKTTPSWSGAAGSGWVSAAYSGVTLPAGDYKTSVWNGAATPSGFNEFTPLYFTSGYGGSGIATGPITVPNATTATTPGQATYQISATTFLYPDQYVSAVTPGQCYWVDAEVTPVTTVNANVSGVAAPAVVTGTPGTPAGAGKVTGSGAHVAVAAGAGALSGSAAAAGSGAHVAVAGGRGTPAGSAVATGTAARVTAAGGAGTLSGSAAVTGTAAHVPVAGGAGTPHGTTTGAANVTGAAAPVSAAAHGGTPVATAVITGTAGHLSVLGGHGTPAGAGKVAGAASRVSVAGGAGSLSAGAAVTGLAARVLIAGGIGTPIGVGGGGNVAGIAARVAAAAGAGTPRGQKAILFSVPWARQVWSVRSARNG